MRPRRELGTKNRIGATVARLRAEKGWKQNQLLAMLQLRGIDIGRNSISELEGQKREVRSEELLALADIFEVSVDCLYNKEEE